MVEMGSTTRTRKRKEDSVAFLPMMIIGSLLVGLPLLGRIILRHTTIEMRREITRMEMEKNKLTSEISELELQKATLSRPERIKEIARNRLGMKEPADGTVIIIPVIKNEK